MRNHYAIAFDETFSGQRQLLAFDAKEYRDQWVDTSPSTRKRLTRADARHFCRSTMTGGNVWTSMHNRAIADNWLANTPFSHRPEGLRSVPVKLS